MSINASDTRFVYSASALGIAASITHPLRDHLVDQTSVVLAPTGGYAQQSRKETNFRDIVHTGRITATVIGEDSGDHWSTLATVTIEDLDIMGVVRADAIVSRLASIYPKKVSSDKLHPATFILRGSAYHGLMIDGERQNPILEDPFISAQKGKDKSDVVYNEKNRGYQFPRDMIGRLKVFKNVRPQFDIPEFGTVFLGEAIPFAGKVTLSLLRLQLGCAAQGSSSVGSVHTNGAQVP